MSASRRIVVLSGIALSLGAALLLAWFGPGPKATLDARLWNEAAWWAALAVLLVYARVVERRPLAAMGLRPMDGREAAMALVGAAAMILIAVVVYLGLFPLLLLSLSLSHVDNLLSMPLWYRAAMIARIAVVGEMMFRAYPIERAVELSPSTGKWIGAAVSLSVFIAATWSGWMPVESIVAAATGIAATALYLWRRNAYVNMLARAIALAAGYLLH